MSQAEDVEDMSSWSQHTCRRELPGVLPKLLSKFECSDSWKEKIRLFNIVTQMFLPHIGYLELEHNVFSVVLPKAVKQFYNLVIEISSQASELSSQNTELKNTLRNILQDMVQWLEALTACVRHVCSVEETLYFQHIQSLPSSVLNILITTFTHCKDSNSVYSGRLHLVSDLLQALFKEAVSLQKQLMELLDKTALGSSAPEKEVTVIVSVLHTFLEICKIVSKMDHALHANTWKFIIKQSIKHQALVESKLRHNDIVSGLCDDILLSFQSCLQLAEHMKLTGTQENADQRLFQKTVKLCRFFANSLLHYTKEFMTLFCTSSCTSLHHLYLQIHSLFPPSLYAVSISGDHKNEITSAFLAIFEPLIMQLLCFRPFIDVVLSEFKELPREQIFPHCLLLINILDKLPTQPKDVQILWCSSEQKQRISIFKAVFQSFASCYPEILLDVVMKETFVMGQNPLTFYQYIYIHLCAYVVLLPPGCLSELESSLLNAVLSYRMMESLLAIDTWCFLARYGTAEFCAHHVNIIAHLVKSCPSDNYQLAHLTVLLRRLLFLMDAGHQSEFMKTFPPEQAENLSLWKHVSLSSMPIDLASQVKTSLFSTALTQCRNWLNGTGTHGDIQQLSMPLSALLTACHFCGKILDTQHLSDVTAVIDQLCPLLCKKQFLKLTFLQETLCLVLGLFAFIVKRVEPTTLTKVVTLTSSMCQEDSPSHVKLAVLDFLSLFGKIIIPHEAQFSVFPKISSLFSMLLADETWIIKQHGLEAFTQFAEETCYEEIVPQSLISEETKNYVVSFLNKALPFVELDDRRLERLKEEQKALERFFAKISEGDTEELIYLQPSAKRARKAALSDEEYEIHIQAAEKSLISVQSLLQKSPIPEWLPEKIYNIQTLLTKLQKSCQDDLQ